MPALRPRTIALLVATIALAGCGGRDAEPPRVTVIDSRAPRLADPASGPLSMAQRTAIGAMAQGLVRFDSSGDIAPGLAERWSVSEDGLSYIFRLAPRTWSNGRKINARDVARELTRQLRSDSRNTLKDTLGAVEDIVAMTDRVIEIRLTAPRPYLLQLLAQPEFGVVRSGEGGGPMVRDTERQGPGLPLIFRVPIIDGPDIVARANLDHADAAKAIDLFKRGERDLVLGGTVGDLPLARDAKMPGNTIRFDPVAGLFGLLPVRTEGPASDEDIRRLLSRAINREALIQSLNIPGLSARQTILQAGLDGIAPPVPPESLPDNAQQRLARLIADADRLFGDERPTIKVRIPDGPGGAILLSRLQADWGAIGLQVEQVDKAAEADFMFVDSVAPSKSPAWFVRQFRCGTARICSEEADALMDSARITLIAEQRGAMLGEAGRLLDERVAFIPLTAPIRWSLVARHLSEFSENSFARHPLNELVRQSRSGGQ
jgi:oligopeptide transport system substrate-binding protein